MTVFTAATPTNSSPMAASLVSISTLALVQMSLHSSKFGGSSSTGGSREHVHGILVGRNDETSPDGGAAGVRVTRVFPVCREVPTKPLVDFSLRLVDAHVQVGGDDKERIVGWYTHDGDGGDGMPPDEKEGDNETTTTPPNSSAACIASAMASSAQSSSSSASEPILAVVTTRGLVRALERADDDLSSPPCVVYQRDAPPKSSANQKGGGGGPYTRRMDSARIVFDKAANEAIRDALLMDNEQLNIYDFVDHISGGVEELEERDWLTNTAVAKFVEKNYNRG